MEFMKYIVEDGLIMVPVLWILGECIKRTDVISNDLILPVLIILSIGFTPWLLGGYTALNIVQAILVAGGAVLADQSIKQFKSEDAPYRNYDEGKPTKYLKKQRKQDGD